MIGSQHAQYQDSDIKEKTGREYKTNQWQNITECLLKS